MKFLLLPILFAAAMNSLSMGADLDGEEYIGKLVQKWKVFPVKVENSDRLATQQTFHPPVAITIVAKTDSTDLRLSYASDELIFNWANNPQQLRIANHATNPGPNKIGSGLIPANKYVTIKWIVTAKKQTVAVDGELRYEEEGDFSKVDKPITIWCHKSKVQVRSIKVKPL